jgi:hypothetical protein
MKNLILPLCILIFLSCKIDHSNTKPNIESNLAQVPKSEISTQPIYGPNLPSEPYKIILDIHKLSNGIYDLEIQMLLYNNAYYASPNAKGDLKGKFTFHVDTTDSFILKNKLIETPLSNEEYHSSTNDKGLTSWISVNTLFKQKIQITTTKDFEVKGFIQFTIEPRCTLEKIPVIVKCENGVLKFEIFQC